VSFQKISIPPPRREFHVNLSSSPESPFLNTKITSHPSRIPKLFFTPLLPPHTLRKLIVLAKMCV